MLTSFPSTHPAFQYCKYWNSWATTQWNSRGQLFAIHSVLFRVFFGRGEEFLSQNLPSKLPKQFLVNQCQSTPDFALCIVAFCVQLVASAGSQKSPNVDHSSEHQNEKILLRGIPPDVSTWLPLCGQLSALSKFSPYMSNVPPSKKTLLPLVKYKLLDKCIRNGTFHKVLGRSIS